MAVDLTSLERTWYGTHLSGSSPTMPLNDLRRRYWHSQVGGNVTYLDDLEKRWLRKVISDNGGTPSNTRSVETLWLEVVATLGFTVSKFPSQNKITFFLNQA